VPGCDVADAVRVILAATVRASVDSRAMPMPLFDRANSVLYVRFIAGWKSDWPPRFA
jgi:hypothetical protein